MPGLDKCGRSAATESRRTPGTDYYSILAQRGFMDYETVPIVGPAILPQPPPKQLNLLDTLHENAELRREISRLRDEISKRDRRQHDVDTRLELMPRPRMAKARARADGCSPTRVAFLAAAERNDRYAG